MLSPRETTPLTLPVLTPTTPLVIWYSSPKMSLQSLKSWSQPPLLLQMRTLLPIAFWALEKESPPVSYAHPVQRTVWRAALSEPALNARWDITSTQRSRLARPAIFHARLASGPRSTIVFAVVLVLIWDPTASASSASHPAGLVMERRIIARHVLSNLPS